MTFDKDIFISFAQLDDKVANEDTKGWITDFHRSLQVRLSQLLGRPPIIWRDDHLQGNDLLTPEIIAQFPKLKVLVSILTPRYLKSEWCALELEEFFKAAEATGGVTIENKARIFKVLKTPINRDLEPEKIRDMLGYEFYRIDASTGRPREFLKVFGQESEQAFWTKLDDVAYDIAQLIEKIDQLSEGANGNQSPKTFSYNRGISTSALVNAKKKIYLADTTYDLREYHESLKRELEDSGFTILPNKNLPLVADQYMAEAEAFMKECILSLHLLGPSYGLIPEGTGKSILVLQNEVAAKQSAERGLNRLIWIAPSTTPEDPRQLEFLSQLKQNEQLQQDSDLLEDTIEKFKFAIFDNIRRQEDKEKEQALALEKEKQKETAADAGTKTSSVAGEPRLIYLVCDQRDLADIKALEDFLFEKGHEVMVPIFEGEEAQLRDEHIENLKQCDAVLVYYGNQNELWLRSTLRDLLKLPALGRDKPLLSKIAYVASPSTPQKERFRSNELTVINGLTGFNPQLLDDFIGKLK